MVLNNGVFSYEYNLTDHLGNVRVSVDQTGVVIQKDDYYPFGLTFQSWQMNPPKNLYGFQGQEYQEETGWHQYKWRNADPALGRFFNVDPLSESFYYNSTYAFSENRVTDGVELEGLEWASFHILKVQEANKAILDKEGKQASDRFLNMATRGQIMGGAGALAISTGGASLPHLAQLGIFISNPVNTPFVVGGLGFVGNVLDPNPAADWAPGMPLDDVGNLLGQGIRYLFRGTTKGFSGGSAAIANNATFTSLDPLKSTIFSIFAKSKGDAVVLASTVEDLVGTSVKGGNRLAEFEKEVILEMQPTNFVEKSISLTLNQARSIFDKMGISVPTSVTDISQTLKETPDLTPKQIQTFYDEVIKLTSESSQ